MLHVRDVGRRKTQGGHEVTRQEAGKVSRDGDNQDLRSANSPDALSGRVGGVHLQLS